MRGSFLLAHSLSVQVERGADVRVPKQFALDFHIRTVRSKQCAVAVPERVPAYPLRDACSHYRRLHKGLQSRVRPVGFSPSLVR